MGRRSPHASLHEQRTLKPNLRRSPVSQVITPSMPLRRTTCRSLCTPHGLPHLVLPSPWSCVVRPCPPGQQPPQLHHWRRHAHVLHSVALPACPLPQRCSSQAPRICRPCLCCRSPREAASTTCPKPASALITPNLANSLQRPPFLQQLLPVLLTISNLLHSSQTLANPPPLFYPHQP